jgi:hypothetical protein
VLDMSARPNNPFSPAASLRGREASPRPHSSRKRSPAGPPVGLRLSVFLTRRRLDLRIAAGVARETSEQLALRAGQLTDPSNQRRIARDLRRVIDYAERHRSGAAISAVVIDAPSVRRGRRPIAELAEQLERAGPASPRGIVLAQALLTDGASPLFNAHADRTVASAVRDIREALEGDDATGARAV